MRQVMLSETNSGVQRENNSVTATGQRRSGTSVRLENLSKKFGTTTAVRQANLEIDHGEFMTLLGPSGCGKTTILSMILGILEPSEGHIYFNNQMIDALPMNKRDVGMVFQNYALFPHMTVAKNVGFGLEMRKVPKKEREKRVQEALEMVQLSDFADRFPKELSGGQQQRVALARALVIRPKVLLLDEPLSNLDAKLRKEMRIQLKKLHSELKITTIYVTHDQEEALSLSTKIAVMSNGVIQQIGTPQQIFLRPKNYFVANFIGYANFIEGTLVDEKGGRFLFRSESGKELLVQKDEHHRIGQKVMLTIKPENLRIVDQDAGESSVNVCPGRILVSDYVGSTTEYQIKAEGGDIFKVSVLGLKSYTPGHDVCLYFDPDALIIIDKELKS
ncbi:spermidine/putrescine ABC transporter ATP-binding subunit [Caldalkalibacillus uzonensis]|uniref:Spermidine/putrescine import ATP-binding protein PotA n=1 Tax=Caldalkalibacillus uzonensis TaxID=353224 RepID=A0ABU0CSY9_9BACI|nr:ABC transporter ATP-binding protein [Caldalkalibacillus uzonensis]MDQ0338610.1 spermidine/putrescine ABC transporter ATP-binding subunit [Caldalkalibacillus uzonensis]